MAATKSGVLIEIRSRYDPNTNTAAYTCTTPRDNKYRGPHNNTTFLDRKHHIYLWRCVYETLFGLMQMKVRYSELKRLVLRVILLFDSDGFDFFSSDVADGRHKSVTREESRCKEGDCREEDRTEESHCCEEDCTEEDCTKEDCTEEDCTEESSLAEEGCCP